MEREKLLPNEQKGCRRQSVGTKDQAMIMKMVMKSCKKNMTHLSDAWIAYKKVYDVAPHTCILQCLKIVKVTNNVRHVIEKSMKNWKVELTSRGETLGEVKINSCIFQGDTVYH